ncbi:MAG TPA: radical SAM protein [Desulfobacteraceae bacterium]|nr:radical SAM protein [Desulfobacteraceae bacterium]HPJ66977.1 radical SAM protein [Desulfobacteraceae bacterium]HPQ27128.1 radical SAM protein [Desulfobacteraceae bacterium]
MSDKIDNLLLYCSKIDFGAVNLSGEEKEFCNELNIEIFSLCKSMPDSTQTDALLFIMKYLKVSSIIYVNFFKYFYVPAWSIIYWLIQSCPKEKGLKQKDIKNAKTAHSMAMLLHSLDDHLNDDELPATHLTLLLRSQAWMIMTNAFNRLAVGVEGGKEIVRDFINKYYSSICSSERIESLDDYCNKFRKEMATWLIVPLLLTRKISANEEFSDAILAGYESFGIAWRLLDDIKDLEIDIMKGAHSSLYCVLPEDKKRIWDDNSAGKNDKSVKYILNYILQTKVIDIIRERICYELESVAAVTSRFEMTGLADEYRCLMKPLKIKKYPIMIKGDENEFSVPVSEKLLSIEVTTQCNLDCLHCFVRGDNAELSSLPFAVVRDIISEGYDTGYRRLHLTGGEPLLWNHLLKTLDYAFSLGYISILINTNGTLLSEDICITLADHNSVMISVSLDGSEKFHNRIRGDGQYERTMRGIENALNAGIDTIIFTTVYKSLLPDLPVFAKTLFEKFPTIKHISLIPLKKAMGNGFALSGELLEPEDFILLIQGISLLNIFGFRIDVLNEPLVYVVAKLLESPINQWSYPVNRGEIIVMADRTIRLSHFSRTSFGQYKAGMIQKVLDSGEYNRAVSPDEKTCPSCKHNPVCINNGMYRPSGTNGQCHPVAFYCKSVLDRIIQ